MNKNDEKKVYSTPEITVIECDGADIITASGTPSSIVDAPVETPDPNWLPGWY